ncbi:MAG: hypothetical protein V8S42_04295 [Lachnospiraceae bacterium]
MARQLEMLRFRNTFPAFAEDSSITVNAKWKQDGIAVGKCRL